MTSPRFRPARVLVTGGAGFIGSNLVRLLLRERPHIEVVVLDLLTYAGNLESLADVEAAHGVHGDGRYTFVRGDIADRGLVARLLPGTDAVLHLAAETHVDRSILSSVGFVAANVHGTVALLDAVRSELAREPREYRFINAGTDEAYGALAPGARPFDETAPLAPNSPYAASKAAADAFVRAYVHTYGLPAILTRCTNNYGPFQFPEKLIPLMIVRALRDERLPVFGDGRQIRDWIHVDDHLRALLAILEDGDVGATYNIGASGELENIDVVRRILALLGKPESLIEQVTDRPGHDRRYGLDCSLLRTTLGWRPQRGFSEGLESTVRWYATNQLWWERVLTEAYRTTNALYLRGA